MWHEERRQRVEHVLALLACGLGDAHKGGLYLRSPQRAKAPRHLPVHDQRPQTPLEVIIGRLHVGALQIHAPALSAGAEHPSRVSARLTSVRPGWRWHPRRHPLWRVLPVGTGMPRPRTPQHTHCHEPDGSRDL